MKLAMLQNSDVMEKNGCRIWTQRPKIIWKQVVLFQHKIKVNFVDLCYFIQHCYREVTCSLFERWSNRIDIFRLIIAFKNIMIALENLSIAEVLGLRYFGTGYLNHEEYTEYIRYTSLGESFLNASANFALSGGLDYRTMLEEDTDNAIYLRTM